MARIHAGLWTDCKNCNPDWKPKKRDRKDRAVKYTGGEVSVELSVRRQLSAELGDEEPNKDVKFALLQKYGAAAARIDRKITKPIWNEEGGTVWNNRVSQWEKLTRGLVPREQVRKTYPGQGNSNFQKYPYRGNPATDKSRRDSYRKHLPNSNPTRTGTRQP